MERLLKNLLKELDSAYPKAVQVSELIGKGIAREVIEDALEEKLIKITSGYNFSTASKFDKNSEIKITKAGSEYLSRTNKNSKQAHIPAKKGSDYLSGTNKNSKQANITVLHNTGTINSESLALLSGGEKNVGVSKINNTTQLQVKSYSGSEPSLITIGKWLIQKIPVLAHTLNWSVVTVFGILTGTSFYLAGLSSEHNTQLNVYIIKNSSGLALIAFIFLLPLTVFWWHLVSVSKQTLCPKCNKRFVYTRKARILEGSFSSSEQEVRNYKSNYLCDSCGFKEDTKEIEEY